MISRRRNSLGLFHLPTRAFYSYQRNIRKRGYPRADGPALVSRNVRSDERWPAACIPLLKSPRAVTVYSSPRRAAMLGARGKIACRNAAGCIVSSLWPWSLTLSNEILPLLPSVSPSATKRRHAPCPSSRGLVGAPVLSVTSWDA